NDADSPAVVVVAGLGDVVNLRGIVIDGTGLGAQGLNVNQVGALHMERCVIANFEGAPTSFGIVMNPFSGTQSVFLSDTIIYNNGSGAGSAGIQLLTTGRGSIKAILDPVPLENNVTGLQVEAQSGAGILRVAVRDSTAVGNAGDGILTNVGSGASAFVFVERSTFVNNAGSGLHADGAHAIILVSDSSITNNG